MLIFTHFSDKELNLSSINNGRTPIKTANAAKKIDLIPHNILCLLIKNYQKKQ